MEYKKVNLECESIVVKEPITKTQKDWIDYFNEKGIKMISAPDIYLAGKEKNEKLVESLRKDFDESIEMTSTRIIYDKNTLMAEIIHDADSKVVKPKYYTVKVPIFQGDFEQNEETEKYLQAVFDTTDSLSEILAVMKYLGEDKINRLWSPTQESRNRDSIRSVGLCSDGDWFCVVGGDGFDGDGGRSRGVC
jgi:hypothetical protein